MSNFWLSREVIVVYAVSLLALAEIVDLTIVAVAIPQIMGALGADLGNIAMVTTSYIVAAAIFIPLSGLVIRKYSLKRVALASTFVFMLSSICCGLATSLSQMIIFRIFQGLGGAFLPSIAQSYIAKTFSGSQLQRMMTLFGLIVVMGPVLGPVLGGALSQNLSWRWVFYVNVPICALGFALLFFFMKTEKTEDIKIDYSSFVLMMLGIGALEYFIDEGNRNAWFNSIEMLSIFVLSLLSLSFFVWRGQLGKSVIDFSLFKNTNFILSCLGIFLFMMLVTGALAYFPTMLQQIYGYPVDTAGYITAPRGIAALCAAPLISILSNRIGMKLTMFSGTLIFALSCFLLADFGPAVNPGKIIYIMILQGFGMMAFFIPIMQICFVGFKEDQASDVSGVFNFFRNFACSVGNSICATIVSHQTQVNYHDLGQQVSVFNTGYVWWQEQLQSIPETIQVALAEASVRAQALLISYLDSYYFFALLLILMLWLPFTLKEPDVTNKEHIMH